MTTLLGEDDATDEEEDYAVEAVLSLDEVTIDIDQFETGGSEEEGQFEFIASSGPLCLKFKIIQSQKKLNYLQTMPRTKNQNLLSQRLTHSMKLQNLCTQAKGRYFWIQMTQVTILVMLWGQINYVIWSLK